MNVKMTFTIPEEIAHELRDHIGHRKRSRFVTDALQAKLRELQKQDLERRLIEAYTERYEEDKAINEEWEPATLEGWPEY